MAPELLKKNPYCPKSADIFACGVVLFCMVNGRPPFCKATEGDLNYRYFMENKNGSYWENIEKKNMKNFTWEFKDLINQMFCVEFEKRITMEGILGHQWVQ